MSPMRKVVFSLLVTLAFVFSGCLGGDKLDDEDMPQVEPMPALGTSIQTEAAGAWLAPGTSIEVAATAPADAVGEVSYTWLIMEDPFTIFTESRAIDTGELAPGQSGDLTFSAPGFYELGHCDPHPWMKHTVAVLDGHDGPDHLDVYIIEGSLEDQASWEFSPEHITVKTGATVSYHNLGQIAHTASVAHQGEPVPVPQVLDLTSAAGSVTVDGSGWMNLVVIVEDERGFAGYAKESIYVAAQFPDQTETFAKDILLAWPEALGEPLELNETEVFKLDVPWKGTLTLDVDVADLTGLLNEVRIVVQETESDAVPAPRVLYESDPMANGTFDVEIGRAIAGLTLSYEIVVTPVFAVLADYTIRATVVFDHTPPELERLPCPEPHFSMGHC